MSTVAIGDVHGNLSALDDLLAQVNRETGPRDTVVFLGDYINRGPDSKGCIDRILTFQRHASVDVVCLRGNHEDWLLRTLDDHTRHSWLLGMEAFETICSYSVDAAAELRSAATAAGAALYLTRTALPYEVFFEHMPPAHVSFFRSLVPYCRSADGVFVHGGLDPKVTRVEDQAVHALVWGTDTFPEKYRGSETVVYGHKDDADVSVDGWPRPRILGATVGLDTISHGVLTAVRLPERQIFQSGRYVERP